MRNMNDIVGSHHILLMTLDTLRYDVAERAFDEGRTPTLARWIGPEGWQRRHAPANFTYASHQAFFAGFLPTPLAPGPHPRLFAAEFPGSETTVPETYTFEEATIIGGLAARGYQTHCIGGVGFFNKLTALGRLLPDLFQHSRWSQQLGVTCRDSTENQANLASDVIQRALPDDRLFLFINVSAIHQPNCMYLEGASVDSPASQLEALAYVDAALVPLFNVLQSHAPWFVIVCSDHGTAYGDDGYEGHRLNHLVVGDVPYADFVIHREP